MEQYKPPSPSMTLMHRIHNITRLTFTSYTFTGKKMESTQKNIMVRSKADNIGVGASNYSPSDSHSGLEKTPVWQPAACPLTV